jgi:hypothetical protein
MDFVAKSGGKVLVHCHAGQGRTAILIGAYLIYAGLAKDDVEAIAQTRKVRPKCFSKFYNKRYMKEFNDELVKLRYIFPTRNLSQGLSLKAIISKQSVLLHGEERRFTRFIPKVVSQALQRMKDLHARHSNREQKSDLSLSEVLRLVKRKPNTLLIKNQ